MTNKYTTLLIGNGLGMAICPKSFTLNSGLKAAWARIDAETQGRIKSLMKSSDLDNENQLDAHYPAIHACQMLSKLEDSSNYLWLDKDARDFPAKFSLYIEKMLRNIFLILRQPFLNLKKWMLLMLLLIGLANTF